MTVIYKIASIAQWREAGQTGVFNGAPVDIRDGYIHFSDAGSVRETAARHFAHQNDLVLIAVDAALLGPALKWEVSRGGALFPHLYAPLKLDAVLWVHPLPLDMQGQHCFPAELP